MNVKCNRAALYEAVQLASSIVPARTPKPILQCAKLETQKKDQKLTVIATDNEITLEHIVPQVQVIEEGATVIPADRIAAILHESRDETIDLIVDEAACNINGKDSKYRIYGHDPDDFPTVSAAQEEICVEIKAVNLKRMIHHTAFAAARENTRYAINGVLWEQEGKKLRMVATDGRRLAMIEGECKAAKNKLAENAIVPVKAMTVMEHILNTPDEMVKIAFSGNHITTSTTLAKLTCNLVQGRFPKYTDVIPSGCDKIIQIDSEALRSAVRRAALLTNEQSRGILMTFSKDQLCLSSSTPEAGDAEINMKIEYQGEPLKIGFSPQYILDVLRVLEGPQITCEFSDGNKPGLIRTGKDFLYVVMPVTV
ncbi:MAG: DNA polymerase III subunit beta [Sedimentisphaerales bacterium]|nr:DNA polymerase III subunit beta [Sedimentisphaerales bacterium]